MTSPGARLERRLDRQLEQRPRNWVAIWATLVLLGFGYPLPLATRLLVAAATAAAFLAGWTIIGALGLVVLLTYLSQLPLIVDLARRAD